ncbi:MAG: 30S ribosomal protein S13 [Nanoarchaeota archaeon]|nr:30S ribosomal protein S13 [Nanoarchaeota archaeon]MBU1501439.1 30S ribosomal protein S13 [Nanoarchaeota archaeon]MBU2458957.1 30S ribosomal protein S13 [Nanoarchaeota archaeon]
MIEEKTQQQQEIEKGYSERIVRILSKDIEGNTKILAGLTKIKGISWSFGNAVCKVLNIDTNRKIGSLTPEEIKIISDFVKNPKVPVFILNRRFDLNTGEDHHYVGTDLELKNEFDIKRLKKIKSYRGIRHVANLPVRGQRTRSNFRANRKRGVGIKSKGKKAEESKKEFSKK